MFRLIAAGLALVCLPALATPPISLAYGHADTSFGTDGTTAVPFDFLGDNEDQATAMDLRADRGIVAAGIGFYSGSVALLVTKLTASGAIDTSFGTAGRVRLLLTLPTPSGNGNLYDIAAIKTAANGSGYWIAGTAYAASTMYPFLLKLRLDGSIDTTAFANGVFLDSHGGFGRDLLQLSNGDVLLLSETHPLGSVLLTRASATGHLLAARQFQFAPTGQSEAFRLRPWRAGGVFVVGDWVTPGNALFPAVAALDADLNFDPGFAGGRVTLTGTGSDFQYCNSALIEGDYSVLLSCRDSRNRQSFLLHLTAQGALDTAFGDAAHPGLRALPWLFDIGAGMRGPDLAAAPNGNVYLAGASNTNSGTPSYLRIAELTTAGLPVAGYGSGDGSIVMALPSRFQTGAQYSAFAVQCGQPVVLSRLQYAGFSDHDFGVSRLTAAPVLCVQNVMP